MSGPILPSYDEMYGAVLTVLEDGSPRSRSELYAEVSNGMHISDESKAILTSNGDPKYKGRIGWAITYLNQAGLIERVEKAVYRITERGKDALKSHMVIDNNYLSRFPEFVEFTKRSEKKAPAKEPSTKSLDDCLTPEERIDQAMEEIEEKLVCDILSEIDAQEPAFFERLVVDVVKAIYGGDFPGSSQVTPLSNDGGIDGIVKQDRLGFNSIYIQAKKWKDGPVGRPEIQKFLGAMDGSGAVNGAFITSSKFTEGAITFSDTAKSSKRIVLIDGVSLAKLMIEYGIGVSPRKMIELKRVDYDYFHPE